MGMSAGPLERAPAWSDIFTAPPGPPLVALPKRRQPKQQQPGPFGAK
jgi:hypothetical protein